MEIKDLENQIFNADCLELMKQMPDKSIDCVITSPPYDNLRTYNNSLEWSFEIFQSIAKELFRVIKDGGVVVWVVADKTIDGSESGTSFKQALYFKEIGFNLHDTMIYNKNSCPFPDSTRYYQSFEYMFILSKGKPITINLLKDRKNIEARKEKTNTYRNKDGTTTEKKIYFEEYGVRYNVWDIEAGYMKSSKDKLAFEHPAIFPERLAKDHILSWSNENDLILDPFLGSGTTAIACYDLKRRYIGIEKEPKYFEIAKNRIDTFKAQGRLF